MITINDDDGAILPLPSFKEPVEEARREGRGDRISAFGEIVHPSCDDFFTSVACYADTECASAVKRCNDVNPTLHSSLSTPFPVMLSVFPR